MHDFAEKQCAVKIFPLYDGTIGMDATVAKQTRGFFLATARDILVACKRPYVQQCCVIRVFTGTDCEVSGRARLKTFAKHGGKHVVQTKTTTGSTASELGLAAVERGHPKSAEAEAVAAEKEGRKSSSSINNKQP